LIVAIGAQNAFVLRQGLRRRHMFPIAMTCALCDAALIALGVGGFGSLVAHSPMLTKAASWVGVAFLLIYGTRAFVAALRPGTLRLDTDEVAQDLRGTILTTLAFSLLNPHVYLDTVVLVGGLAAQYPWPTRGVFGLGAVSASFLWFFSLAFSAGKLTQLFSRPITWRVLDVLIGIVMWSIAWRLLSS
jgi:L-lysine exporter family protein LysE/ArgO